MPRYLLVEIDSNDSADRMRAQIDTAEAAGKGLRVVAMFAKPPRLCECVTSSGKSARGAKFGWWLCPECRRPRSGSSQTLRNLLDDPDTPSKYLDVFLSVRWVRDKVTGKIRTARSLPREQWR